MTAALCALLCLICGSSAFSQAPAASSGQVQASVEPQQASAGETVVYVVKISYQGNPPSRPEPRIDPSWGFARIPGDFVSNSYEQRQNQIVQSVEYRFPFTVSKEGQFTIPPVTVQIDGRQHSGNAVTLTVRNAPAAALPDLPAELKGKVAAPVAPGNPDLTQKLASGVFILPALDSESIYEGQQVEIAYHLVIDREALSRAGLTERFSIQERQTPELKQFSKELLYDLPQSLQFQERSFGGKKYAVAPLFRAAITPVKTGKLVIEPYKLQLAMQSNRPRQRGGARSPFDDPFFNDPFFSDFPSPFAGGSRVAVVAQSAPIELEVKPAPQEGRPADFSGAVGEFSMSAQLDKRAAVAGEDIVVMTLTLEGQGDAATIPAPDFPSVDGLALLEQPSSTAAVRNATGKALTSKTFTYKLRPTKAGTLRIPPMSLSVFDPATAQYKTLQTEPLEVQAVASSRPSQVTEASATASAPPALAPPAPAAPGAQPTPAAAPREFADDMRYIHTGSLTLARQGALTGDSPLLLLLLAAPPALLLAGWAAGRRRAAISANVAHYRAGRAGVAARRHLKRAAALLKRDEPVPFYEELARALRGYFGDRFRLDPSGLTTEQIEDELRERGAGDDAVAATRRLLDQADQARYAAMRPTASAQEQSYSEAAQLLDRLEKLR